jgi:hypothetical protein
MLEYMLLKWNEVLTCAVKSSSKLLHWSGPGSSGSIGGVSFFAASRDQFTPAKNGSFFTLCHAIVCTPAPSLHVVLTVVIVHTMGVSACAEVVFCM